MENFTRIAIIGGSVFSLVTGALVAANFGTISTEISALMADQVDAPTFRRSEDSTLPSLQVEKIAAPANGSVAKTFEIVIDEPREAAAPEPEVVIEPEIERTFGEKVKLAIKAMGMWLLGKEPTDEEGYTMDCKKKKDGGKVCQIKREG